MMLLRASSPVDTRLRRYDEGVRPLRFSARGRERAGAM